jgi:dTDP-4-dehydrorhamnose reductase
MTKRLIVTGAGGFVAGSILSQAGNDWEVHALSRKEALVRRDGLVWHLLDPLDEAALRKAFCEILPDTVIHTAAAADIDYCETHQQEARRINGGLVQQISDLSSELGAMLVFTSTDTVFDGSTGHYTETDAPSPVNFYGQTKAEAEGIVSARKGPWAIGRVSLVMGLPMIGEGNSFLSRMLADFKAGKTAGFPDDEIRSPIDVVTLGRALLELAAAGQSGYYHLSGNDTLSRLDLAKRIAGRMGYPPELVAAKNSSGIPGRAPRPRDVSLDNTKARSHLSTPFLGVDEGLELILSTKGTTNP